MKDVIAKKDEELQNFQKLKGNNNATVLKRGLSNLRLVGPSSPRRHSIGASPNARRGKAPGLFGRGASDVDNTSEYSSKHSDSGSQHSSDERKHRKDLHQPSKFAGGGAKEIDFDEDVELLGLGDADSEERLSDISDSCLSMGTETDGSISSAVELTLFPETVKPPPEITERPETHIMTSEKPTEKSAKMVKAEPKDRLVVSSSSNIWIQQSECWRFIYRLFCFLGFQKQKCYSIEDSEADLETTRPNQTFSSVNCH